MLKSYTALNKEHSETVVSLAEKITELVINSSVTYGEADEALNVALEMLETKTRPVMAAAEVDPQRLQSVVAEDVAKKIISGVSQATRRRR